MAASSGVHPGAPPVRTRTATTAHAQASTRFWPQALSTVSSPLPPSPNCVWAMLTASSANISAVATATARWERRETAARSGNRKRNTFMCPGHRPILKRP